MAYVEPLDAEVEMNDPLVLRIPLNMGLLVAVTFSAAVWTLVIAGIVGIVALV
jgi:hypothetical protein